MTLQATHTVFNSRLKMRTVFTACLVLFITVNVLIDYLSTLSQNSAFYLSESLLFSSYWILFLPLLTLFLKLTEKKDKIAIKILLIGGAIAFHLLSYPALIWIVSKIFYSHTFSYWQTFNFGISAYLIKTIIIYGFMLIAFSLSNQKIQTAPLSPSNEKKAYINSILISDSTNRKTVVAVNDILYFSANSPYVNIYQLSKKHLYSGTLKSLEVQLDNKQFVRIHKSYIVNINKIISVRSRQNGDYDITLTDDTVLRLSRNYAKNFKLHFSAHQLSLK
ncbi:LytR/AlgR family response regulator transcription factor [Flavobacterium lindanitolerans]|uniref:LytTr DNA-binding domain-containing protein n=1 Tax=Flavobacterium lindanitolerans TaxID=428988 RepID=A0A497U2I1_9FLAO|nr:LytTR family DNA-binding domain-containing protein [Flavobacterium lindanitolerans]PKW20564.1 LytTr DNA-binding domain-containing protein [Flavobacterium lindanitolerans]RLJ24007.1 LytTr DNA-binding domain-containing protein [Flavobacterium lindanitolerans]